MHSEKEIVKRIAQHYRGWFRSEFNLRRDQQIADLLLSNGYLKVDLAGMLVPSDPDEFDNPNESGEMDPEIEDFLNNHGR